MGKMKVHELAKELGMQSKELVDKLIKLKYDIKSHLSTLEDEEVEKIRKQLKGDNIKVSDSKTQKENVKKEKNPEKEKHGPAKSPKPKRRKKDVRLRRRH